MKICPIVNYSENTYSACVKPIAKTASGGWKLLTEPLADNYCFSYSDKSLMPSFLNSLLEIKESHPIQKVETIKDRMLKAMGYKHPELMRIMRGNFTIGAFDMLSGNMIITPIMVHDIEDKELIGLVRHELEHMNQEVKLYKSLGEEDYIEITKETYKNNPKFQGYEIPYIINLNFYKEMAKDADTSNFDIAKFCQAKIEYNYDTETFEGMHGYIENPYEKGAYEIQKRVLNSYGINHAITPDTFPINYQTIIELMDKLNIPKDKQFELYYFILRMHIIRKYLSEDEIARAVKVMPKVEQKLTFTPQDARIYSEINTKTDLLEKKLTERQYSDLLKDTEESLKQGKYAAKDILKVI